MGNKTHPLLDMVKSLGGSNPTVGAGTSEFVKAIRETYDAGKLGVTPIDDLAKSIGNVDENAIKAAKSMQQTGGSIEDFNKAVGTGTSGTVKLGKAIKNVATNMGAMIIVIAAIKGAMWIFDQLNVTFEEQQEIVDDLTDKVNNLKSEYEQLQADPSTSDEKLNYLKRELDYQERLLKIEERKLAIKDIEENMPSTSSTNDGSESDDVVYTPSGAGVSSLPKSVSEDYTDKINTSLDNLKDIREQIQNADADDDKLLKKLNEKEENEITDLRDYQSKLAEKLSDYTSAQNRFKEYIEDGTLIGDDAKLAQEKIDKLQAEIDKLEPLVLPVDIALGDANFEDKYNYYLDKIKQANSVEQIGENRDTGYGGTLIKASELDEIIDKNKTLNTTMQEGKITSKEYFDSMSQLFSEGSKIAAAYQNLDLSEVTDASGKWVEDSTDYLEQTVSQMVAQIADATAEVTNAFNRGDISVKQYYDSLQASGNAQLEALKTTNKLEVGQDGLAHAMDKSNQAAVDAADAYNELHSRLKEMDITESLVDVNTKYADTLNELSDIADEAFTSDAITNYVNEASQAASTYIQNMYDYYTTTGQNFQSFIDSMNEQTGASFTQEQLLASDAANTIANHFGNTAGGAKTFAEWIAGETAAVVSEVADNIGSVLEALGDTIASFDYTIKISLKGQKIKWSDMIGVDGINIPNIDLDLNLSGSGGEKGNVTKLGNSIHNLGSSLKAAKDYTTSMIKDFNNWTTRTTNNSKTPAKTPATTSPSTSKTPSSKGSGGSGSGSSDTYTADIDKYKNLSDAVENVKDKIEELNNAYDATDNIEEQIALKNVLISLYKDEQDALTKLNNARDKEISENVATLRKQGFKIDYDPTTDNLVIHNREYLNKISQANIKDTEEMIKSTEDLNDKNKESLSTWKELNYKISDVNKELNELKHTQYENNVKDQEHLIELLSKRKDAEGMDVSIYGELMNDTFTEWFRLIKQGYEVNKETIQDMENDWKDYYDKRLDAEKEILEKQKESKDNVLSAVTDLIDEQIKSIDDEIDSMKKLNEERQEALDLQQKQAALDKANSQKTNKVLRKGEGWVYEADEDSIREAEQALADAQYEKRINALEKEKEELEDYKNIWSELPDLFEKEQNRLLASEKLGANWEESILDQRIDVYNKFKDEYFSIQQQIKDITTDQEEHLNATYVNMMKVFELMYKINQPKTSTGQAWYVNKDGKAPSEAKVGDIIYTNGGTYKITGKDENGKFQREKLDNNNAHITDGLWGTKATQDFTDSVDGITESNKKIVDAANQQVDSDKRQILASQGLSAILGTNTKATNENILSMLEGIVSVDKNTESNEDVQKALEAVANALANFTLVDEDEEQKVTVDKFDDSIMSDSDRAYIKSIQAAWNEAMKAGNKELADTLHEMAENVRDKYRSTQEFDYQLKDVAQAGTYQYASDYTASGSYNIGGANADENATKKYLENLAWLKDKATKIDENTGQTVGSKEFIDRLDRVEDIVKNGNGLQANVYTDSYGRTYTEINTKDSKASSNSPTSAGSKKTESLSKSDSDAIKAAQKAYNEAKAKGDTAGMNQAHADAEAIRNKNGYSGGIDGSKVIEKSNKDVSKNLANNSKNIERNSDTSEDNTKAMDANTKALQANTSAKNSSSSSSSSSSSGGGSSKSGSSSGSSTSSSSNRVTWSSTKNSDGSVTNTAKDSSGKTVAKYTTTPKKKAKGGLNLVAGTYNVDELGDELIINPKEGRYTELQTGASVIPADVSKRLWEFGANPEQYIQNILPAFRVNVPVVNNEPSQIIIENMVAHLPAVTDSNDFMKTLPAKAKQFITDKTIR